MRHLKNYIDTMQNANVPLNLHQAKTFQLTPLNARTETVNFKQFSHFSALKLPEIDT